MKVLLIGGTGTISMAISRQLLEQGEELYLLNRGNRKDASLNGAHLICADIHNEKQVIEQLGKLRFDAAADFIAFEPEEVERDFRLLKGRVKQYFFISSASAYQKPLSDYRITESTPLCNPYWDYSRKKIACEEYLIKRYREDGFPVTIIRPSHTYDDRSIPLGVHGACGSWQVAKRMLEGKPVIIHGDGTSLWTMTHNTDFARAFIGLIGNPHAVGETVQITSDETLTWNQIYQAAADALGVTLRPYYVPSDFLAKCSHYDYWGGLLGDKSNSVVFDNSKLKRLVPGYNAVKRFDQGVKEAVQNILSHPEYQREDAEFDAWCDEVINAMEEALHKLVQKL